MKHQDLVKWEEEFEEPLFVGAEVTVKPSFEYYERRYYENVKFIVTGMFIDSGGLNFCLVDPDKDETDGFYVADMEPFKA